MSQQSAQLLKDFLHKHNLTQTQFAKDIGLSRTSVYKYLNGANIHRLAAIKIEKAIRSKYLYLLPFEKLIE